MLRTGMRSTVVTCTPSLVERTEFDESSNITTWPYAAIPTLAFGVIMVTSTNTLPLLTSS